MHHRIIAVAAALLLAGPALAQASAGTTAAKTSASPKSAANTTKTPVVRTAKSLDCSKQADTKGLHGKPRKSFMSSCKKA